MRDYPESPLVHAALKRIARFHGGDVPRDAEAIWKQAVGIALERDRRRRRDQSLCGPLVLAEVFRRTGTIEGRSDGEIERSMDRWQLPLVGDDREKERGRDRGTDGSTGLSITPSLNHSIVIDKWDPAASTNPSISPSLSPSIVKGQAGTGPDVEELAREMGTNHEGTSLAAMARVARAHGFRAEGLRLTYSGLRKTFWGAATPPSLENGPPLIPNTQHLTPPRAIILLIDPGHYVLVEDVLPAEVKVWDPSPLGASGAGVRTFDPAQLERIWSGAALVLR